MDTDRIERHFTGAEMPVMRDALMDFAKDIDNVELPQGLIRCCLDVKAHDANGVQTGTYHNEYDLSTKQLAQFIQVNILDTAQTITDTTNATHAVSVNTAATVPIIVGGTVTTAATNADYKLGSQSSGGSGSVAATINAWTTTSSTSGNFTVTGTITNTSGGTINYAEVGIEITASSNVFLLSHDVFTALGVSNSGTLAVTYTLTFT